MTQPQRLQLSRKKGFNLQHASRSLNGLPAVHVARPGPWGNPFHGWVGDCTRKDAALAVELFRNWLRTTEPGRHLAACARRDLRGKNLACWCKPNAPCHADVLLEIANA